MLTKSDFKREIADLRNSIVHWCVVSQLIWAAILVALLKLNHLA
jgi:hypothetical protein